MRTLVFENKALNGGFTQVPNSILYDNSISQSARFLYTVLLSFAWTQDQVFPGQDRLVDILSCSKRSVRTYLIELKEKKLISWKQRGLNKTNIYTISDWNDTYQAGAATIAVQERQPLPFKNGTKLPTNNTKVNNTKCECGTLRLLDKEKKPRKETLAGILSLCEPYYPAYAQRLGLYESEVKSVANKMGSYLIAYGIHVPRPEAMLNKWLVEDIQSGKLEAA